MHLRAQYACTFCPGVGRVAVEGARCVALALASMAGAVDGARAGPRVANIGRIEAPVGEESAGDLSMRRVSATRSMYR